LRVADNYSLCFNDPFFRIITDNQMDKQLKEHGMSGPNCNSEMPGNYGNCSECGTGLQYGRENGDLLKTVENYDPAIRVSPGLIQGADKIIRWVYELNMWKNPVILFTVWKVLLLASLVPALLMLTLTLFDGDGLIAAFTIFIYIFSLSVGAITALLVIAYPLVAFLNGGKYCVIFEMDELGIRHIQMKKQYKKARIIAAITTVAGIMSGSAQAAGAGMLAGSRRELQSEFAKVKRLIIDETRNTIILEGRYFQNQVYVEKADFAYVCDYIASRCRNAVIRSRKAKE